MDSFEALIAEIQEAPFAPQMWSEILLKVARLSGGWSGQLFALKGEQFILDVAGGYQRDLALELSRQGGADPARSPRPRHFLRGAAMRTMCDADYLSPQERDQAEIYRNFYERVDGHYNTAAQLYRSEDAIIGVAINHSKTQGPPSSEQRRQLEYILPHLRDATLTQLRLERHNADIALGSLDALSIPAILCDEAGQIVRASRLGEQELASEHFLKLNKNCVQAVNPSCEAKLRAAVKLCSSAPQQGQHSVLLLSQDGLEIATADIAPLPANINAFRLGARSILALPNRNAKDAAPHLSALGLTSAESAVAILLFQGQSVADIALQRRTTRETVKTQIKAIYGKLSVSSRVELHEKLRLLS